MHFVAHSVVMGPQCGSKALARHSGSTMKAISASFVVEFRKEHALRTGTINWEIHAGRIL